VSHATLPDGVLLEVLDSSSARLASVTSHQVSRPVPTCPGWTIADVIFHTGQVQRWATAQLRCPPGERARWADREVPADGDDVVAWFRAGVEAVLEACAEGDPGEPVWTWAGHQPRRWWLRRLAQETTVHAWDVDNALGRPGVIAPAVAVDGIDEFLDVFVPARFDVAAFGGTDRSIHLHATDDDLAGGEWLVRIDADAVTVDRRHAKGDVAARAPATDLVLALWGRIPLDRLEVFGDEALLERFVDVGSF